MRGVPFVSRGRRDFFCLTVSCFGTGRLARWRQKRNGRVMAREKSPAFQFYPSDFLSDINVAAMTLAERGAYITLLCLCWTEQSLPTEHAALAKICGVPKIAFTRLWPALQPCFKIQGTRLVQPRLDRERQKQEAYRALKVEAGKKGGTAKAANRKKASTT